MPPKTTLLMNKQERDKLFNKIECLEIDLKTSQDNIKYYAEQLGKTRSEIIDIFNLVGAETSVGKDETSEEAWERVIEDIKGRLE